MHFPGINEGHANLVVYKWNVIRMLNAENGRSSDGFVNSQLCLVNDSMRGKMIIVFTWMSRSKELLLTVSQQLCGIITITRRLRLPSNKKLFSSQFYL